MILIADGGSTKVDWAILDTTYNIVTTCKSSGMNPAVLVKEQLYQTLSNTKELANYKNKITAVFFYGAGCGTPKPKQLLQQVFTNFFTSANIYIAEDMLGAVYATNTNKEEAIIAILGTGSNSCYFNQNTTSSLFTSMGYLLMDEASGNYFGKILLRDYFYNTMPQEVKKTFEKKYNLNPDFVKQQLYKEKNPNMYLASHAKIMLEFKNSNYIKNILKNGFNDFIKNCILPYKKNVPLYFIGSIAYYFEDILKEVANNYNLTIANIIQKPINGLISYHKLNQ